MNECHEGAGQLVVACSNGAKLLQLAHQAFDAVATAIQLFVMRDRYEAVALAGDHCLDSIMVQGGAYVVAVVGFVHDSGFYRACFGNCNEDIFRNGGIVLLTRCQNESKRGLLVSRRQVELGAEAAPTTTE